MPYLRYKHWNTDGLNARKAVVANHEYTFLDADEGVCFIPTKRHTDLLLRHDSGNYEVAWERYGVSFDGQGNEVAQPEPEEPEDSPRKPRRPTRRS